jgi:hypothetical protein
MRIRSHFFILFLMLFTLPACSSYPVSPAPIPTELISASADQSNTSPFKLIEYSHSQKLFNLKIPKGWAIKEENSFSTFTAPDETASIRAAVINTGIALDEQGFSNLVNNTEMNDFGHLRQYRQDDPRMDEKNGTARVTSHFMLGNIPQDLISVYLRKDNIIFSLQLQTKESDSSGNQRLFEQIFISAQFNQELANNLIPYNIVFDFTGPHNLFKLLVPTSWKYDKKSIQDGQHDQFSSPDETAKIANLTYDDGNGISPGKAGQLALTLLGELYAKDVRITEIKAQPDGSTRWSWSSERNHLQGTTFFEVRGTAFLMLSLYSRSEYQAIFAPLFAVIIENYQPMQ